ncbi:uncharacterized protein FA14DRAFT_162643 [Meira miltonrushii]|uniref:Zn(2)-C6 fungal-type domain-containing protein n=1 Tax=Meira miltonrushii TaxID=1280837 RepID=A0A316V2F5_9BASI|nr:uncharacterized protein FA14DRAFT_162643 [Meira miltonrushii]PWN31739.1 hypothetical protein FA14DRAFT_162643 [Meira miltonrushii]
MKTNIRRISLACSTCRARKVKCDGERPACRSCIKNGVTCVFNETSDQRKPYSKSYVKTLEARITALEAEVSKHKANHEQGADSGKNEAHLVTQPAADTSIRQGPSDLDSRRTFQSSNIANNDRLLDTMIRRGGCLSFVKNRTQDPYLETQVISNFYGASSGRNIPAMSQFSARAMPPMALNDENYDRRDLYYDRINEFVDAYFQHYQPILGLLNRNTISTRIGFYGGRRALSSDFLLTALGAIGALSLQDYAACHFFTDIATRQLAPETVRPSTSTVQALVLMALTESSLGCESRGWLYIGMASRIALEIGLPRDIHDYCRHGWIDGEEARLRHRTTWALFIVDRMLALYYGRFPSIGPESISLAMPSRRRELQDSISLRCPFATGEKGEEARLKGECVSCESFEPGFVCLFELSTFSVDINARLYINPVLSGEAGTTWLDWASDMNVQMARWLSDLPITLKCNFTRGRVPSPLAMHIHIVYHSLIILLNRPFLALSAKKAEARFAAQSCHFSSREIVRLTAQIKIHHGFQYTHNFVVYCLHASATIAVINAKLGTGTIQREAKNDIVALFALFRVLRDFHRNAALVLNILTELVQAAFARDPFLQTVLSSGAGTAKVKGRTDDQAMIEDHLESSQTASTSYSDTLASMHAQSDGAISSANLFESDPGTTAEFSQFAMVDWDLFATSTLSTVIDYLDVQPWLQS